MNKLAIFISSKNNYEMLENEVLKNNDFENFELINIDDCSNKDQYELGIKICKKYNIKFLKNTDSGIQWAFQTAINNCSNKYKWMICIQHDCYPVSKNFFSRINKLINDNSLDSFGAIGFNFLQEHSKNSDLMSQIKDFFDGKKPMGFLGLMHFTVRYFFFEKIFLPRRALSTFPNIPNNNIIRKIIYKLNKHKIIQNPKFKIPFIIEMPWWPIIGINIEAWKNNIKPTNKLKLHLWFPDVMMTFNKNNLPCLILPSLYCLNNQSLKIKYGIMRNSADAPKDKLQMKKFFGEYGSHLNFFREKWGWDYQNVRWTLRGKTLKKYEGTLIEQYLKHNIYKGPLKNYDLGDY